MLVKCETKSNRVKGLSFHPKLNWILASLHNGVIQLWDFRIGSLIERYEEHEGPVRGVDFHASQPIFVSGGDDYKIKVWNYRQRRCIFTLLGHLDYIRTVQFHPEYPWILSSSDDQTVRIWNWQNRSCIAVLAGHNHYVMCAQFHPKQDLLVSASLDQTIRVWDIAGLREKTVSIRGGGGGSAYSGTNGTVSQGGASGGFMVLHPQQNDMFGTSDAICKFILEGHDRGVNWATFHPTMPLIASGADDRLVKLWRYNETKWWEVDTFRGHFNNVSSVLFHPNRDLLLSNSEDRTIRVWDITKRILVHTFRRENDRFWILTALKNSNVIAVGHDSGMVVFKLDRERPASFTFENEIFYVKDKWITAHQCYNDTSVSITAARRPANAMSSGPRSLMANPLNSSELNLLVYYREPDGGGYDLITVKDVQTAAASPGTITTRQGTGNGAVFVSRNRFAVLESSGSISIMNLNNELSKRFEPSFTSDRIFYAGNNRLLLKSEEQVHLYDLTAKKSLAEVSCPGGARYAIWSSNYQYVALICKHHIIVCDSKLEYLCSIHENIRVKGGAWDPLGAFVYSTLSHIKYCLPNGDQGIMRCLTQPVYILKVQQQKIWLVDRESQDVRTSQLNATEYLFKLALHAKQFDQVALLIRQGRLCGNAVVSYLRTKGFAEVALQFVADTKTRFNLAIEDGNLEEATTAAIALDDKACWERLGIEAMRQGNFQTAEMVYQKTKNLDKLSFFYLITGNTEKLKRMLQIAEMRGDVQARFNNALFLGDVEERIRVLAETAQLALAALAAKINNVDEYLKELNESEQVQALDLDSFLAERPPPVDLRPPTPLVTADIRIDTAEALRPTTNWPRLKLEESKFESALAQTDMMTPEAAEALQIKLQTQAAGTGKQKLRKAERETADDVFATLGDELDDLDGLHDISGGDAWGDLDDVEIPLAQMGTSKSLVLNGKLEEEDTEECIRLGEPPQSIWCRGNPRVSELVAAGKYDEALEYLAKRIGLINADPLEPIFSSIVTSTFTSLPLLPLFQSKRMPLLESGSLLNGDHKPIRVVSISNLLESTKEAHREVTAGKIENALAGYRQVLCRLSVAEASTVEEETQLNDLLSVGRSYALAMFIESERQKLSDLEGQRSVELAAYLACSKLQPTHHFLTIRRAMTVAWKAQNFITSTIFARKLIQGNFSAVKGCAEAVAQAKKVLVVSEKKGTDKHAIDFDASEYESIKICAVTLKRISPTEPTIKCPFCGIVTMASFSGSLCPICQLSELGARVLGLQFRSIA